MPRKKVVKSATRPIDLYISSLLGKILLGKRVLTVQKGDTFFTQGDHADAVYFVQSGKVKVTVLSTTGKEAMIAMIGPRDLFGEGALSGESVRSSTSTALEPSVVFRIEKAAMAKALASQPALSATFIAALLARNVTLEEDLCDQLFNHSERRLARALLKVARLHQRSPQPDATIPLVSHEILAEMVGTTRSRITYFMNKFRKLGLIDYDDKLTVRTEKLTNVVLRD